MDKGNETDFTPCRFLHEDYFQNLYDAFGLAFSDYVIPFALTEDQFRSHIHLTAVDLERTVGCLENGRLIGFSLNGFGDWEGHRTVYDAGTGVIPECRRRGVSEAMFRMMIASFKKAGMEQFLLEVITTNDGAIKLYEKLGFRKVRTLALLQRDVRGINLPKNHSGIEVREIAEPDWNYLQSFWDGTPSWQNSTEAVKRSLGIKRIFGAFLDKECLGYVVFSARSGRIAQGAVHKEHRRRGIGTELLQAVQNETADGFSMQVINIDTSLTNAMTFFKNQGFYERLNQYEMLKTI